MADAAGNSLAVQYLMRSIMGNDFLKDQEQDEFEIALDQVIFRLPPPGIVGGTVRRILAYKSYDLSCDVLYLIKYRSVWMNYGFLVSFYCVSNYPMHVANYPGMGVICNKPIFLH